MPTGRLLRLAVRWMLQISPLFAVAGLHAQSTEQLIDDQEAAQPAPRKSYFEGNYGLGDFGGLRTRLENRGVSFFGGYSGEFWRNTRGGLHTGNVYTGLLDFGVDVDFKKLAGWEGATFHASGFWLSGRDVSQDYVGNLFTVSNIAGYNTVRAFEIWFEQSFFTGKFSIRIGQLATDQEFIVSDTASLFQNAAFGWPAYASQSHPSGGAIYPTGALGVRVAFHPVKWFSFLAAAYQGDPCAQNVNTHGFRYRLSGENGATMFSEAQFRWEDAKLPGTVKFGGIYNTENFKRSNGSGDTVDGNYGFYGVFDQALYRETPALTQAPRDGKSEPAKEDLTTNQGLNVFARAGFTPQDRNFLSFTAETGLAYTGIIPGRDEDVVGIALAYADLSHDAARVLSSEGSRDAGDEIAIEASYSAKVTPWLSVQPDVQYIIHPGATADLGDALVIGGRVSVIF